MTEEEIKIKLENYAHDAENFREICKSASAALTYARVLDSLHRADIPIAEDYWIMLHNSLLNLDTYIGQFITEKT